MDGRRSSTPSFYKERKLLALGYLLSAFLTIVVLRFFFDTSFPVGTILLLGSSFFILLRRDVGFLGLKPVPAKRFVITGLLCLVILLLPILVVESATRSYANIIDRVVELPRVDPAFLGLARWGKRGSFWTILYLGLIGTFVEEIFFRGILIRSLRSRLGPWSVLIQAVAFVFLNLPIAMIATPRDSLVYLACYTFPLATGLGWAAYRTGSIWPGVCALNAANIVFFILY